MGKVFPLTASTYASIAPGIPFFDSIKKFLTNRGVIGEMPNTSCNTIICAVVSGPAPIPMTGTLTDSVIVFAYDVGTHSSNRIFAPESSNS